MTIRARYKMLPTNARAAVAGEGCPGPLTSRNSAFPSKDRSARLPD